MKVYAFLAGYLLFSLSPVLLSAQTMKRDYWPTEQWRSIAAAKAGFDEKKLAAVDPKLVMDYPRISSFLIVRNGYLVHEKYFKGDENTLRTLWSQTKSVVSILVGVLISRGKIKDVDQHLLALVPELQSKKTTNNSKNLTIKHLLTMTSGFPDDGGQGILGIQNLTDFLTESQQKQTGEEFIYNGTNANLLSLLISRTTGHSADSFASSTVFKTLGIKNYMWQTKTDISNGAYGLAMRSRDIAKIAYLYLNSGKWAGENVVRENWVQESTRPIVKTGETVECLKSYGYLWWVGNVGKYPAFLALGLGGQVAAAIPGLDMIIVITADAPADKTAEYTRIMADYVLSSMRQ